MENLGKKRKNFEIKLFLRVGEVLLTGFHSHLSLLGNFSFALVVKQDKVLIAWNPE